MKIIVLILIFGVSNLFANNTVPSKIRENFYVFLTNKPPFQSPIEIANQPADFYTHFNEKIVFEQEYEVGLKMMCIDREWKNINDEEIIEMGTLYGDLNGVFEPLVLQPKNYETIGPLIQDLNQLMGNRSSDFTVKPYFYYNYNTSRVNLRSGKCLFRKPGTQIKYLIECFPHLSPKLGRILGFETDNNTVLDTFNWQDFVDISKPRRIERSLQFILLRMLEDTKLQIKEQHRIFESLTKFEALKKENMDQPEYLNIFTNIIIDQLNNMNTEKNLTTIKVPRDGKNIIMASFREPVFHRLSHREFQEILIRIKDNKDRLINFDHNSTVWAVLEFRKF